MGHRFGRLPPPLAGNSAPPPGGQRSHVPLPPYSARHRQANVDDDDIGSLQDGARQPFADVRRRRDVMPSVQAACLDSTTSPPVGPQTVQNSLSGVHPRQASVESPPASDRRDRWLVPVGVITMAGVVTGVAVEGIPAGTFDALTVTLLVVAAGCWAIALSGRIQNLRVVVPALVGLGLCGAGLDWQTDGPGFVVGYMALAALALRAPRRIALLTGTPIILGIGAADAHDSANPASAVLTAVLGAGFLFVTSAVAAVSRDAHHRAETLLAREAAVREAREQMAKVNERSRLARELHDVLAHCLSGLSVQLEGARLLAVTTAADPRLTEQVTNARGLAQDGMLSARRALQALRGDDVPSLARLPELISETASTWSIPIAYNVDGTPRALDPELGLTVYRAVQEALTNTTKHAGRGVRVSVVLIWAPDNLEVTVTDNGGDGVDAGMTSSGLGLTCMAERAAAHGGRLDAGSWQEGFRVRLQLPIDPNSASRGREVVGLRSKPRCAYCWPTIRRLCGTA